MQFVFVVCITVVYILWQSVFNVIINIQISESYYQLVKAIITLIAKLVFCTIIMGLWFSYSRFFSYLRAKLFKRQWQFAARGKIATSSFGTGSEIAQTTILPSVPK